MAFTGPIRLLSIKTRSNEQLPRFICEANVIHINQLPLPSVSMTYTTNAGSSSGGVRPLTLVNRSDLHRNMTQTTGLTTPPDNSYERDLRADGGLPPYSQRSISPPTSAQDGMYNYATISAVCLRAVLFVVLSALIFNVFAVTILSAPQMRLYTCRSLINCPAGGKTLTAVSVPSSFRRLSCVSSPASTITCQYPNTASPHRWRSRRPTPRLPTSLRIAGHAGPPVHRDRRLVLGLCGS